MKKSILILVVIILVGYFFYSILEIEKSESSPKITSSDKFKNTIVKSQFFDINPSKDTLIIGKKGTKIIIPKGSFVDKKGNIITKNIQFELSEALTINDMILSNLTTSSNGKLLETDGMIFINASANGKNLTINKDNPLYIEIPTKKKKPNMQVYEGIRDEKGNMNWINPKKLEQFLIPVDLELLDFLPNGFEKVAKQYLDYHKLNSSKKNIDSLYYNLPSTSFIRNEVELQFGGGIYATAGVKPSSIKTIKSKEFNNTLIATKEFEERLKLIFESCNDSVLELYINNLNLNLWEIDSLVIEKLQPYAITETRTEIRSYGIESITDTIGYQEFVSLNRFIEFKNQRLTNVEHKNIYINQLKDFYNKRLLENIKRSDSLSKLAIKKENESEIRKKYARILKEREEITMQSYGFVQSQTGWINIDRGAIPKDWNYQGIEVLVENETEFSQVHTYVIYKEIKSIVKLSSINKKTFSISSEFGNTLPVKKKSEIKTVSIAYKGEQTFFALKSIITNSENGSNNSTKIRLKEIDKILLDKVLLALDNDDESTSIKVDLELSKIIKNEKQLKYNLYKKALPCYSYYFN